MANPSIAENASITTTTAETNISGMENATNAKIGAQNEKASPNGGVLRDIQRSDDQKSLKDQIKANQETLNKMDPVAEVEVDDMSEMNKTEKTAYVLGVYGKRFKNGIERSDIGFIEIGKKQIKAAYKYLHTDAEYMALAAVPDVIEKGEIVTDRANHKGRGHSTVTIAAPVTINGKRGNLAVVLKKTEGLKYKVHRILSPDGSVFTLENTEAEPTTIGMPTQKMSEERPSISSASDKSIAEKEKDVKASNEKSSVKRSISAEEAETQRKESFDALLKEEESKKEETPKQKTKTAEEIKAEEAESAQEAEETRNYEEYKKAETEAFKAIEGFNFLPADIRYNITRMYMEMADVKDVTKETKKALASIMAVRPGLHIYASDRLADNGAYWISRNGMRVIVVSKNSGAVTNTLLHEITHALATENSKEYQALSKTIRNHMVTRKEREKVRDAYIMRHLIDHDYIFPGTSLADAKEVFKSISKEEQNDILAMVREELTARGVATALGNKNFLETYGKEHRFAIMRAIAHLRKLGASLTQRSDADKYLREIEKNFKAAAFKDNAQAERFMKRLGEWEEEERAEEEIRRALADISPEDVEMIRTIGKKSINDFTEEDLQKAEKWVRKFYAELGTKSPFFRAWFGDWREHDHKTKTSIIPIETLSLTNKAEIEAYIKKGLKEKSLFRGNVRNKDTDFDINIGAQVYNDTLTYANREYSRDKDFDSYLARITLLSNIKELTEKSIFLDTETVTPKDNVPKQTFMHVFYSVVNIGEKNYLAKVKVDELDNEGIAVRRAYNVNNIEISPVAVTRDYSPAGTTDDTGGDSLSINSISDLFAFVKTYDKDFSPNPSSAIRNADGTPKIMYHGSPAQFSAFDKKKAKSSGLYGRGFYFTDSDSHAKTYGNTYAVYLDVKSPLSEGSATVTTKQIRKYLEAVAENEDYSIENYGTYDIDEILKKITARDAFAVLTDINATAIGDLVEATKLWNAVNGTKFDGIVVPTETVVFEPTQIKSATDNIGTFSRYDSNIYRSINIEDRIITTHDERTKIQKTKDFVNTVRSRSAKENAQAAWTSAELAAIKLQILTTNAQAGIEHQLMAAGFAQDVVESATNMARMGARKGEAAITSAQTDLKGNIVGDSLMKRLAPALPNRKDFSLYMVHLLNIDRAPRGKAVFDGMTEEESRKEVARLEKLHPEFKDVAKELQEFDKNLLQLAVDARLISQEQADAYHKLNPHYFTIRRIRDGDPSTFKSGAFRVKDFSKSAKGGDDNIVDPIEAYIDHVTATAKEKSTWSNVLRT